MTENQCFLAHCFRRLKGGVLIPTITSYTNRYNNPTIKINVKVGVNVKLNLSEGKNDGKVNSGKLLGMPRFNSIKTLSS